MAVEKNEVDEVFKAILYAEDPQEFKKKVEHISKEVFSERRKEDGTTPLMLAVSEDREDLFDVLIGFSSFVLFCPFVLFLLQNTITFIVIFFIFS